MHNKWILCVALCGIWSTANAAAPKHKDLTASQVKAIQQHQRNANLAPPVKGTPPLRPFSEVEDAGYFFVSSRGDFNSAAGKKTMIANLPSTVTAVVFTEPGSDTKSIRDRYKDVIPLERLKVVEIDDSDSGFWARDGLPIATWSQKAGEVEFVDSQYYHGFEPDADIAKMFGSSVIKNNYYFEGGNLMTNDLGDCITVDNDLSSDIPSNVFADKFGCKNTFRLPFRKGIGHIDESVRFIRSKVLVSDDAEYAATLRAAGFQVEMLPRPDRKYETYVNAMLVNDVIYVPIFGEDQDEEALKVYRSFGLKVVGIESTSLSNNGLGSLHCITMSYPKIPFQALLQRLGAREL